MRVTGSSTSPERRITPQALATPVVLKGLAASAAVLPLLACIPQSARVVALAAPGALAAAAGGVLGQQTLGQMVDLDLGEITQSVGALVGASAAATLSATAAALTRDGSVLGSLMEGWASGVCVGVGMAMTMGALVGNRRLRRQLHLPTFLGTLGAGVFIAGLNCLILQQ